MRPRRLHRLKRNSCVADCMVTLVILVALVACGGKPTSLPTKRPVPTGAWVITNGQVIDGTGADPVPAAVVVIQGRQIVAVGRAADWAIPSEVRTVDAQGGTVLPGIINAHVHDTFRSSKRRFLFLLKGVTATCDLGAPLESIPEFAQNDPTGPAARGFFAGPIITAPEGYPDLAGPGRNLNYEVASPEEAKAAVADLVNRGVDVIKIALEPGFEEVAWPVLNVEEVKAIVNAAHANGRLVRAHVTRDDMLRVALEAGLDVVEHVPVPQLSEAEWEMATQEKDHFQLPDGYEDQLRRMVAQEVMMVPTLSVTPSVYEWYDVPPAYQSIQYKLFLEPVRLFYTLGGVVALGNDYPNPGAEGGMPLLETQQLLAAGLTPMEVIEAGTQHAAYACGHGDELGTLEPGKIADIIIVKDDPLTNMGALNSVIAVVKGGEIVSTKD